MQLLAGPDADDLGGDTGGHGLGEVGHAHRRDLGDEDLAALGVLEANRTRSTACGQRDPEAGHPLVGDRELPGLELLLEQGDDRAPGADDVAVPNTGEAGVEGGGVGVALDDDLLLAELGGAVEVDRVHGLVGRQGHDLPDAGIDGAVHDVLSAEHVGLHGLEGVVLTGRHLLHGRGVDDHVDALAGPGHAGPVADVAEHVADLHVAEAGLHLRLLQLVAGVDPNGHVVVVGEQPLHEGVAERAGAAREQDGLTGEVHVRPSADGCPAVRSYDPRPARFLSAWWR